MQEMKCQEKRRAISKPPTGCRGVKGSTSTSLFSSSAKDHAKGLATVLYGLQDSCGLLPGDKFRMQQMVKEIVIKRALSPPPKRFNLRWRNFHPKPSRLSTMSTA